MSINPVEYWYFIQAKKLIQDNQVQQWIHNMSKENLSRKFIIIDFANIIRNDEFFTTLCMLLLDNPTRVKFTRQGCLDHKQFHYFLRLFTDFLDGLHFNERYDFIIIVQDSCFKIKTSGRFTIITTEMNFSYRDSLIPMYRVSGRDGTDDYLVLLIYQQLIRNHSNHKIAVWSADLYRHPKFVIGLDRIYYATLVITPTSSYFQCEPHRKDNNLVFLFHQNLIKPSTSGILANFIDEIEIQDI